MYDLHVLEEQSHEELPVSSLFAAQTHTHRFSSSIFRAASETISLHDAKPLSRGKHQILPCVVVHLVS